MPVPFGPNFRAEFDGDFDEDRRRLGLAGPNFDYFFADVVRHILDYPLIYAQDVPDSGGTLMRATREAFPDVPALYVYYRVVRESPHESRVIFLGLSPAWSQSDFA